jgi:hypothetical protein
MLRGSPDRAKPAATATAATITVASAGGRKEKSVERLR